MTDPKSRSKAFTYIELLIVLGVLAVLAAIFVPMALHAAAQTRRDACLANLGELGKAVQVYAVDWDDSLPMAAYDKASPRLVSRFVADTKPLIWADLLLPYGKTGAKLFHCPDDPISPLAYGLNDYLYRQPDGIRRYAVSGGELSETENGKEKILMAELPFRIAVTLSRPDRGGLDHHLGGGNYLYFDSHADHHALPSAWKTLDKKKWDMPEQAQAYPCPQWFPWVKNQPPRW